MSNYLLMLCSPDRMTRFTKNVNPSSDECNIWTINNNLQALYISRSPISDVRGKLDIFRGFCIDHKNHAISFSDSKNQSVAPEADSFHEGAYFRCMLRDNQIKIGNDAFSQLLLLHFCEDGVVAVSDSLYILSEVRKSLNLPVEINIESMIARSWTNAMASQILSTNTPIQGIKFAPPGSLLKVVVDQNTQSIDLITETRAAKKNFKKPTSDYYATIIEGINNAASTIDTISSINDVKSTLDLSGGLDSRSVFAAAAPTLLRDNNISIISNREKEEDYIIARMLVDSYGLQIKSIAVDKGSTVDQIDPIAGWLVSCLGVYDMSYVPTSLNHGEVRFRFGGHGAEVLKGNYGWRSILRIAGRIEDKKTSSSFLDECSLGLNAIGIDSDDPWGSEWHYLAYRNSIHSGRFTMSTMHGVRPILQRNLVGLTYSDRNRLIAPSKGELSIVNDFLACAAPNLAFFPFQGNKRIPSFAHVTEAAEVASRKYGFDYKSISPFEVNRYKISGSPFAIRNGSPRCFIQKAIASGYSGSRYSTNIIKLVERASHLIPNELKRFYNPFIERIKRNVFEKRLLPQEEGNLAGKLMIFLLTE